jgi:thioredoxin 1
MIYIDNDNFKEEVEKSKTRVIIDFYADWCGPCQMMADVFESLSQKYKGKLKFVKINTDENPELAEKFEVQGIPCLVIVKNSKEISRIVGYLPENALKEKIDEILDKV